MRYELKMFREELPMVKVRKNEEMLRDLLAILPTLRTHQLEADIHSKVKTLRAGRTQKSYSLELSRKAPVSLDQLTTEYGQVNIWSPSEQRMVPSEVIIRRTYNPLTYKAAAPISRKVLDDHGGKVKLLRQLKTDILSKVRAARKANKPPVSERLFREGVKAEMLAEVYLKEGTFLQLAEKRVRINMTKAKTPRTADKHLGVELEFACKQNQEQVCDALFAAGVGKNVQVKRDGSIAVDDSHPHQVEINILARQEDMAEVINKVCDVINNKLDAKIDKSCGLHVHVDMRTRDHVKSFFNLVKMQKFMYSMNPAKRKARRDEGGYSLPVDNAEWHQTEGHYHGVNSDAYTKYKTLELRMHCGTSQARKINNWIAFILSIVDSNKLEGTVPDSIKEMQATLNLSDNLVKYIESRLAKFATQHKKLPNPGWMGTPAAVDAQPDNDNPEASEVA